MKFFLILLLLPSLSAACSDEFNCTVMRDIPDYFSSVSLEALCRRQLENCSDVVRESHLLNEEQLQALSRAAVREYGDPNTWDQARLNLLGGVVLGLNQSNFRLLNLTGPGVLEEIGKASPNITKERIASFVREWRRQRDVENITSEVLRSLRNLICGLSFEDIEGISDDTYRAAAQAVGETPCLSPEETRVLGRRALSVYGSMPDRLTNEQVAKIGNLLAEMPEEFVLGLSLDQWRSVRPSAVRSLPADIFKNLSREILEGFTDEQKAGLTKLQMEHSRHIFDGKMDLNKTDPLVTRPGWRPEGTSRDNNMVTRTTGRPEGTGSDYNMVTRPGDRPEGTGRDNTMVTRPRGRQESTGSDNNMVTQPTGRPEVTGRDNNMMTRPGDRPEGTGRDNTMVTRPEGRPESTGNDNNMVTRPTGRPEGTGRDNNMVTRPGGRPESTGSVNNRVTRPGGRPEGTGIDNTMVTRLETVVTRRPPRRTAPPPRMPERGPITRQETALKYDPSTIRDAAKMQEVVSDAGFGRKIPPRELKNLNREALKSPDVMSTMLNKPLTDAQKHQFSRKVENILQEQMNNGTVDADYLASSANLLSEKTIKSLSVQDLKAAVTSDKFDTGDKQVRRFGSKLGNHLKTLTRAEKRTAMMTYKKVMKGFKRKDFRDIMSAVTVDDSFMESMDDANVDKAQGREMVNKFINTKGGLSQKSSSEIQDIFRKIPSSMRRTMKGDLMKDISDAAAPSLLADLANSSKVEDAGQVSVRMPGETRKPGVLDLVIVGKIRKNGLTKLDATGVKNLMKTGAVSPRDVRQLGKNKVCLSVADADEFQELSKAAKLAIAETCSDTYGTTLTPAVVDKYGPSLPGIHKSKITSVANDNNFPTVAKKLCQYADDLDDGQLEALAGRVKARIDSSAGQADLSDDSVLQGYSCVIPRLGKTHLDKIVPERRPAVCRQVGSYVSRASSNQTATVTKMCLQSTTSLRDVGKGMSGLRKVDVDNTLTDSQVQDSLDILQQSVVDCGARKALLAKAKAIYGSGSSLDNEELAMIGTLAQHFTADELAAIPRASKCSLMEGLAQQWQEFDKLVKFRADRGFTKGYDCIKMGPERKALYDSLKDAEDNYCDTASRRRKRATGALTSTRVQQLGQSVAMLSTADLSTLTADEYVNCANILGTITNFTAAQWSTILNIAKAAWGNTVSSWTSDNLIDAGGVVSAMSITELSSLNLNSVDAAGSIGSNGVWTATKLLEAFKEFKADYLNNNVQQLSQEQLIAIGNLACGMTTEDISLITAETYCGAGESIGALSTCEEGQLRKFAEHAQVCYGTNVGDWQVSQVSATGAVLGGLAASQISQLTQDHVTTITSNAIAQFPVTAFNGFTATQLGYFTTAQASVVTDAQYQSLDANRRAVLDSILATVANDTDTPNGNGCADKNISVRMMVAMATFTITRLL